MSAAAKAEALRALHRRGDPLLLPNIWDPLGARILAARGFPAVATASAAVSASLGYEDGELLRRETLVERLGRIARSVDVPVTADIEAGYGETEDDVRETVRQVIAAGCVGINLEDSLTEGGPLRTRDGACRRIAAARDAAEAAGVPLVINARVDTYLSADYPDDDDRLRETVARASAYQAAGADCLYPIGAGGESTLRALRERIDAPLNVFGSARGVPLAVLRQIGIERVSFGPALLRDGARRLAEIADGIRVGDLSGLESAWSGRDLAPFLDPRPE